MHNINNYFFLRKHDNIVSKRKYSINKHTGIIYNKRKSALRNILNNFIGHTFDFKQITQTQKKVTIPLFIV